MAYTYILYSESLGKYYTGSTSKTIEERLAYHRGNHKGYTSSAKDWRVIYAQETETISESRDLEKRIKKRGAQRFLEDK